MIPKKIHYCWFGGNPLPQDALMCIESWKKYFPDYEIIEWNEKNFDKDDYNNFKSYLICAGGALAVSEIYSWMKNISNRSTTVSRLKHD